MILDTENKEREYFIPSIKFLKIGLPWHYKLLACAINAACAALVDAGVPLSGLVGKVSLLICVYISLDVCIYISLLTLHHQYVS